MKQYIFILAATLAVLVSGQNDGSQQTALDDFVYSDESLSQFSWYHATEYDYVATNPITGVGYSAYVLNMTSGEWLTEDFVGERSHWWHVLIVVVPDNLNPAYATNSFLYIDGNKNTDDEGTGMPDQDDKGVNYASTMATGVGVIGAALYQIPNAPIVFADDPTQQERVEDEIVAYTWHEFFEHLDKPEYNVYMAMARGGVRALDAITEFTGEFLGTAVEQFTVAGRSKRGWTTWLTGAMANDRVRAIIPLVWDGINLEDVFHSQWRNYEGWSFAIEDYVENHIMEHMDTPEMLDLQNLIDPYFYRTRLTMPKLICTGLMDEFQMPDDEMYWWDELPAEGVEGSMELHEGNTKWMLKIPNNGHGLDAGQETLVPVMGTFLTYILNDWDIPYLTWDFDDASGDITVYTHGGDIYSAQMWYATTCTDTKRDFRLTSLDDPCTCGGPVVDEIYCPAIDALWSEQPLEPNEDGSYTAHLDAPTDGHWSAFVVNIQMTTDDLNRDDPMHTFFTKRDTLTGQPPFPVTPPGVFEFTSRASIVPNTYPYDDCTQEGCAGELV